MSDTLGQVLPATLEVRITSALQDLCDRGWTIATAESCTGGLLASVLTDVSGVSHAFERGFVVYSEAAKVDLLGVPSDLVAHEGAVSEAAACAMAEGALARSGASLAVSVTGYAGPGGPEDEEGRVHLALALRSGGIDHRVLRLGPVGRGAVRLAALEAAVDLIETVLAR